MQGKDAMNKLAKAQKMRKLTRCESSQDAKAHKVRKLTRCESSKDAKAHKVRKLKRCKSSQGAIAHKMQKPEKLWMNKLRPNLLLTNGKLGPENALWKIRFPKNIPSENTYLENNL